MGNLTLIQNIAVWAIPVLFAITLHEVAHGWAALKFGDRTAQMMGRLSLNPIKHIDPLGTVAIPLLLLISGSPYIFGQAKPVPVTFQNLRNPKRDMIWVALAGPAANLVMAIMWAALIKIAVLLGGTGNMQALIYMGIAGIQINAMLMILNLLPMPPLDGGRILVGLLPGPLAWRASQIEPYGFFILIGLLFLGVLTMIISPLINGFLTVLTTLFGI